MTDPASIWNLLSLSKITSHRLKFDDDFSDRLNYQFCTLFLFVFIGLIGIRQYAGKSIQCWMPQEFSSSWEEYVENYCWVSQTHFSPSVLSTALVESGSRGSVCDNMKMYQRDTRVDYYQWAPMFMVCQALCFCLPCLLWRVLNTYSYLNVNRCIQMALETNYLNTDALHKNIRPLARYMEMCIIRQKELIRSQSYSSWKSRLFGLMLRCNCFCCDIMNRGNYLLSVYFIVKVLYVINVIGQLYLMEYFVGSRQLFLGFWVLQDLLEGATWTETGHFPRVTFCCVQAKKYEDNLKYTIQCVLPLNMFLEKMYIFLWLWYFLVGLATLSSTFSWIIHVGLPVNRVYFIKKYIKLNNYNRSNGDKEICEHFVHHFLHADGVFLLHLISLNCGDLVAGDVIHELWQNYSLRKNAVEIHLTGHGCRNPSSGAKEDFIV